jgi:iron-sulfur cluster repair protein YtfE (RIC family)
MRPRVVPENPPGTPGLKRDPALLPLSQDHHAALVQAQALSRAAEGRAPYHRAAAPQRVARAFLAFRQAELLGHFADEEQVVFPLAEPVDPGGTARVRAEHAEMNALATRLEASLAAGEDPRPVMAELGALLHDHVRFEERAWFETLQQRLGAAALERMGREIAAQREARGRAPGCALPPPH